MSLLLTNAALSDFSMVARGRSSPLSASDRARRVSDVISILSNAWPSPSLKCVEGREEKDNSSTPWEERFPKLYCPIELMPTTPMEKSQHVEVEEFAVRLAEKYGIVHNASQRELEASVA